MNLNDLLYSINFFELIAAVLSVVYFEKYKNAKEKHFAYFLWSVVFIEFTGFLLGRVFLKNNLFVYNFYTYYSFIFYLLWFNRIVTNYKLKSTVIAFLIIFIIVGLYNFIFTSWEHHHKTTFITGAFFTVFSATFHFYELLNNDEIIDVKHKLSFWISAGLLLFNVGMIPFMIFSDTFNSYHNYRNIILIFLNLILYTCYSLGFIWVKEKNNN